MRCCVRCTVGCVEITNSRDEEVSVGGRVCMGVGVRVCMGVGVRVCMGVGHHRRLGFELEQWFELGLGGGSSSGRRIVTPHL